MPSGSSQAAKDNDPTSKSREVVIPLISDGQFFELLSTALEQMSAHLKNVQSEFLMGLTTLSQTIADSARPASSVLGPSFHPLSPLKDHAGAVRVRGAHLAKVCINGLSRAPTDVSLERSLFLEGDIPTICRGGNI